MANSSTPLINRARLIQLHFELGNDAEILREIVATFFEDMEKAATSLRAAARDAEFQTMKAIAHSIKGSAGTIGAQRLSEAAAAMEKTVASAETDGATLQGGLEYDTIRALDETTKALQSAVDEILNQ